MIVLDTFVAVAFMNRLDKTTKRSPR